MSFLPEMKQRADKVFEDPFTGNAFIQTLYESNYAQYKYLKERADQRTYSYSELFVQEELENISDEPRNSVIYEFDAYENWEEATEREIRSYKEDSVGNMNYFTNETSELTQMMDYYALDEETEVSTGNSSQTALKEIAGGKTPEDSPYVYYVYLNYDGVGNVENCSVSAQGNAGEFLKRVETLGRMRYTNSPYDSDGIAYIQFYNYETDQYYSYKFTVGRPRNMKIVYAMTDAQYQAFLNGYDNFDFLPNYEVVRENSYFSSGATGVIVLFWGIAMALGFGSVFYFNRGKRKGTYLYPKLAVCRLPLEVNVVLFFLGLTASQPLVVQICAYYNGWFLETINDFLLEPLHLTWTSRLFLGALFFFYFWVAFTLGSILPEFLHFKRYFKEHSVLYHYWDKIVAYFKNFYQELVNFDIGTNAKKIITKLVVLNFVILAFISLCWVWGIFPLAIYSVIIYFLLKKYVKDVQTKYQNLLKATSAIAKGDLDIALSEDFGVFESYKNELRQIQTDFKKAVDEEVKSQRMKSELITNVSHDLKTPLTAIITYINLLKEPGITPEQQREYIETLDKKAVRLKVLIEDLFEVSKATTNNITLNFDKVDIGNLLRQCYLEYEDRIEEAGLQFKFMMPDQKVILTLDPQKTFRIFENLYTNIVKYALPGTRVYVMLRDREEEAEIEIKNISKTELQIAPDELTERFVRGDGSRNTEGSGLGLAIARSFTELQHGSLQISVDGDLFKVKLTFRKWNGPQEEEK